MFHSVIFSMKLYYIILWRWAKINNWKSIFLGKSDLLFFLHIYSFISSSSYPHGQRGNLKIICLWTCCEYHGSKQLWGLIQRKKKKPKPKPHIHSCLVLSMCIVWNTYTRDRNRDLSLYRIRIIVHPTP